MSLFSSFQQTILKHYTAEKITPRPITSVIDCHNVINMNGVGTLHVTHNMVL